MSKHDTIDIGQSEGAQACTLHGWSQSLNQPCQGLVDPEVEEDPSGAHQDTASILI